jgi:Fe-Mn family superoxide dismutase
MEYAVRSFDLKGLRGISDETLELHFKLYAGYVKGTNALTRAHRRVPAGPAQVDQRRCPAYSELTRRLGFEYNRHGAPRSTTSRT